MRCNTCGANGSGRFCSSCGMELAPSRPAANPNCMACGGPLGPGDRFCGACGADVSASSGNPARAPTPPAAMRQPPTRAYHPPTAAYQAGPRRSGTVIAALVAAIFHVLGTMAVTLQLALLVVDEGDDTARLVFSAIAAVTALGGLCSFVCAVRIMAGSRFAWFCGLLGCFFGMIAALPALVLFILLLVPPTRAWVRARSG